MKQLLKPVKMRHFYKHVLSGIVFWLLLSQTLSLFNSSSAASTSRPDLQDVADSEDDDHAELNNNAMSPIEVDEEEGSEGRYFGDLLKIVKREIRDGETGRSSSGIFNTTLAFTIPLFSFSLPDRATAGKDYTKQAALSLFGLAIVGGIAIMPYVWTARSALGKKTVVETEARAKKDDMASSILPMLNNVASFAGLDAKTCVQRSVCETYRNPERYGYLVLPIRYFMLSPQSRENDKPSGFQLAADFGRQETEECERRYRCAFSLIGAANFLVSYFYPPSTA
ncbi:uncharacterized protein LOC130689777 [Daphnia carinata]|uniref:uncharacterized protein LOC130689777 n=1 Tax=Daphnia carinata TaxID=120202 RepID=UPI0025804464|nr:uncharacterized protein LOC130689777 [Daphnia carinata]